MDVSDSEGSDASVNFLHESMDQSQSQSFKFTPVDGHWRRDCCSRLGLELVSDLTANPYERYAGQSDLICAMDEEPEVVEEVVGDGNCLFRALSHIFTAGCQDQHPRLRDVICSFMELHQRTFARIRGESVASFTRYIQLMQENFEWGTDVELLGCATMLQTPIATYLDGKWVFYFPCFQLDGQDTRLPSKGSLEDTKVIYLTNTYKHYSPVISIKAVRTKVPKMLSPIISNGQCTATSISKTCLQNEPKEKSKAVEIDRNEIIVSEPVKPKKCYLSNSVQLQNRDRRKEPSLTPCRLTISLLEKAREAREKAEQQEDEQEDDTFELIWNQFKKPLSLSSTPSARHTPCPKNANNKQQQSRPTSGLSVPRNAAAAVAAAKPLMNQPSSAAAGPSTSSTPPQYICLSDSEEGENGSDHEIMDCTGDTDPILRKIGAKRREPIKRFLSPVKLPVLVRRDNLDSVEKAFSDTARRKIRLEPAVGWLAEEDKKCDTLQDPLQVTAASTEEIVEQFKENLPTINPRIVQPRKAWNIYMSEHRYRIRATYPELNGAQVSSQAMKEWYQLKDKTRYNKLADEDKRRYEQEKECGTLPRPTKKTARLSK